MDMTNFDTHILAMIGFYRCFRLDLTYNRGVSALTGGGSLRQPLRGYGEGGAVTDQSWVKESSNVMRTIRVSQGLFVLRYVTSKAGLNAPLLEVSAAPSSGVELICPHD